MKEVYVTKAEVCQASGVTRLKGAIKARRRTVQSTKIDSIFIAQMPMQPQI